MEPVERLELLAPRPTPSPRPVGESCWQSLNNTRAFIIAHPPKIGRSYSAFTQNHTLKLIYLYRLCYKQPLWDSCRQLTLLGARDIHAFVARRCMNQHFAIAGKVFDTCATSVFTMWRMRTCRTLAASAEES